VVASRVGGVGELVEDGKTGYLVTPGREDELIVALKNMQAHIEDFRAREPEIRARVAPHSLAKYVDELEKIMTSLAQ